MNEQQEKIRKLLREAGELHHKVYRIVNGDDPDWASWYTDWLLELSELPEILGKKPIRSHLIHALVELDKEIASKTIEGDWQDYYAKRLLEISW
ncbi:MAG: hypothetical protein V4702_05250 [Patescibacteria group bacterium]